MKQNKLLMQSLREHELLRKQVGECYSKMAQIMNSAMFFEQ